MFLNISQYDPRAVAVSLTFSKTGISICIFKTWLPGFFSFFKKDYKMNCLLGVCQVSSLLDYPKFSQSKS